VGRLANALAPVFASLDPLYAGLQRFEDAFNAADRANVAAKLGLETFGDEDHALLETLYRLLQEAEIDMTIFFRALIGLDLESPSIETFSDAFYDEAKRARSTPEIELWLRSYAARVKRENADAGERRARMRRANPKYVLRNYLAQEAIDRAEQGDASGIEELLDVMRHPYAEQPGRERFAARRPDWARNRAGCSMLSCSS
jgi:serine/tyrosine/threonine adenylyltransferase